MHQHVPKILGNVKHITATVRGPVTIRPYFNERNFSVISTRSFPRLFSAPKTRNWLRVEFLNRSQTLLAQIKCHWWIELTPDPNSTFSGDKTRSKGWAMSTCGIPHTPYERCSKTVIQAEKSLSKSSLGARSKSSGGDWHAELITCANPSRESDGERDSSSASESRIEVITHAE